MPKQQASVLRYCSSLQILLFYMYYTDQEAEKAILVGVALQSEGITYEQMTEYLDELSFLAETAGAETVKIFTQNLDKPEEIQGFTSSVLQTQQRLLANNYVSLSEEEIREIYKVLY